MTHDHSHDHDLSHHHHHDGQHPHSHHHGAHSHPHVHHHTPSRLDNPARVLELNPEQTLAKLGFKAGQILCDIGAGSGIFTIPAAQIAARTQPATPVLALDINPDMLDAIKDKAADAGLVNIDLRQVVDSGLPVADATVDLTLLVTVLHEIIEDKVFLSEIHRLLKPAGKLAVIEFHKAQTPSGPPVEERLDRETVKHKATAAGMELAEEFDLGPNFYCQIFVKK